MSGLTTFRRAIAHSWARRLVMVILLATVMQPDALGAVTTTFNSTDVPVAIPETPDQQGVQRGRTESTIVVSGIQTAITKVTVSVYLTHQWVSDLEVTLFPPGNAAGITLAANIGGNNRNGGFQTGYGTGFNAPPGGRVVFDEAAAGFPQVNPVASQAYILSGTYQAAGNLDLLNGRNGDQVNGTWTLRIDDEADQDQGTLRAWSLSISEPGPHIWTGAGGNTDWSTAGNWVDGNVPTLGEVGAVLVFPDTVTNRVANNNIGDVRCSSVTVAGGYSITGQKITLAAGGLLTVVDGTPSDIVAWGIGIDVVDAATITRNAGTTLNLTGVVANDGATVGSVTFAGTGTAVLSVANTYTGAIAINAGVVAISNDTALGTAAAGTSVADGATLRIDGAITTTEALSLAGTGTAGQGALATMATTAWGGAITLAGSNSGVGAATGTTLTISAMGAQATGAYGFTAIGPGAVTLNATLPNNTRLGTQGSLLTVGAAQPNLSGLTLNGGTITPNALLTVSGSIAVGAHATGSTLAAGTINLNGGTRELSVGDGAALNDLTVNATFTTGALAKSGTGTVLWNSTSTGVGMSVSAGVLTGNGALGNVSIGRAKFAPTAAFAMADLTLADNSWLAYDGSVITATGTVTIGGGVLQPFASGTVIAVGTGNSGEFAFYPRAGSAVTYSGGDGNDVVLTLGGATASFTTLTYTAAEGDGPVQLAVSSTGGMTVAVTSAGGSLTPGGDFVEVTSEPLTGADIIPLTIIDDFVSEGTETGQLILIPLTGGVLGANGDATLTITDNDGSDTKTCGFGTGLTVFLLLGFGLLLHVRLRRP